MDPQIESAFGDLSVELDATRRMLAVVPDEHFDWQPHEKSMSLGSLASHVANLLNWFTMTVTSDELDMEGFQPWKGATTNSELMDIFDTNRKNLENILPQISAENLTDPWTFRMGEHVIFTQPKGGVLRRMCISHLIHHRGQLSVYLRLLDVPLPQTFGPTADDTSF